MAALLLMLRPSEIKKKQAGTRRAVKFHITALCSNNCFIGCTYIMLSNRKQASQGGRRDSVEANFDFLKPALYKTAL